MRRVDVVLVATGVVVLVTRTGPVGGPARDVVEREPFAPLSLGYPSGHAAVSWAITIIVLAYLGRPWRLAAIVLAIVVPLYRMYVAAHLPLDLIGGAALGVAVASLVNALVFRPPQTARVPSDRVEMADSADP